MNSIQTAKIIGLTGGMGCGKSTVCDLLSQCGLDIIDADQLTRQVHHDPEVCREFARIFGQKVIDFIDGSPVVNRSEISKIIFSSRIFLDQFNDIMKSAMQDLIEQSINRCEHRVILDAALLFEANWQTFVDTTVAVLCPMDLRIQRILNRDGLPVSQIKARILAQINDDERIQRADYLIYNVGTREMLEFQVKRLFSRQ